MKQRYRAAQILLLHMITVLVTETWFAVAAHIILYVSDSFAEHPSVLLLSLRNAMKIAFVILK
jgi:hypothetical protein